MTLFKLLFTIKARELERIQGRRHVGQVNTKLLVLERLFDYRYWGR
jgi:hypothetical protein